MKQLYQGISRELNPNWLGWYILDLIEEKKDETENHLNEIQIQLDYEVRLFKLENENIHPKRH